MGAVKWLTIFLKYPLEFNFKTLIQLCLYYLKRRNSAWKEHPSSGWDRQTMRRCWELLDTTDKRWCMVAKQLDGDLPRVITLCYIALRALDTIEDDMTLPITVKQSILRSFYIHTITPGWKFDRCGPNDKYRQYLVEYDNVVEEINLLSPQYKNIIIDTVLRIGTGMADYAYESATTGSIHIETVAEYDQYCHYTGGITVQAVSQIISASGQESISVGTNLELSNSVGLFFQKSDIIRDYREDVGQQRYFWPREFWGQEGYGFKEITEMHNTDPDPLRRAMYVQSAMILDALQHVTDTLDYLRVLKNQSVFHVFAIAIVYSFVYLELCFMHKENFQRRTKMRKMERAKLMMRCTNMGEVALIFREYARKIHAKAVRSDPNFIGISIACGKIEQYCEPCCVEKSSTTKISTNDVFMYIGAAFLLVLMISLSRAQVY